MKTSSLMLQALDEASPVTHPTDRLLIEVPWNLYYWAPSEDNDCNDDELNGRTIVFRVMQDGETYFVININICRDCSEEGKPIVEIGEVIDATLHASRSTARELLFEIIRWTSPHSLEIITAQYQPSSA